MSEHTPERRSVLTAYAVCAVLALVAAIAFATAGDWWEHRSGNAAFLLLPVSNVRFWFIPFTALACATVAARMGRSSTGLNVSAIILVLLCVVSTVRWYRIGLRLGPHWTAADVSAIMDDHNTAQMVLGSLMLLGIALFAFGIRDSLRVNSPEGAAQQSVEADEGS